MPLPLLFFFSILCVLSCIYVHVVITIEITFHLLSQHLFPKYIVSILRKMSSKELAKQAVRDIASKHGHLREEAMEDLGKYNPELRREIEESWLGMEHMLSHSIKT